MPQTNPDSSARATSDGPTLEAFEAREMTTPPNGGAIVEVYEDDVRRRACCTCVWFRNHQSCRHTWIAALVQAGLNHLGLRPMPTFRLCFGQRPQPPKARCRRAFLKLTGDAS